jgi:hypothetical protein
MEGEWQFTIWGREITIWAWPCFHAIFDLGYDRRRWLPPMFGGRFPGKKINMAHANLYTPLFGFGIEIWKH